MNLFFLAKKGLNASQVVCLISIAANQSFGEWILRSSDASEVIAKKLNAAAIPALPYAEAPYQTTGKNYLNSENVDVALAPILSAPAHPLLSPLPDFTGQRIVDVTLNAASATMGKNKSNTANDGWSDRHILKGYALAGNPKAALQNQNVSFFKWLAVT